MKMFDCQQEQSSHTLLQYTAVWSNDLELAFQLSDQYTAPTWAYDREYRPSGSKPSFVQYGMKSEIRDTQDRKG